MRSADTKSSFLFKWNKRAIIKVVCCKCISFKSEHRNSFPANQTKSSQAGRLQFIFNRGYTGVCIIHGTGALAKKARSPTRLCFHHYYLHENKLCGRVLFIRPRWTTRVHKLLPPREEKRRRRTADALSIDDGSRRVTNFSTWQIIFLNKGWSNQYISEHIHFWSTRNKFCIPPLTIKTLSLVKYYWLSTTSWKPIWSPYLICSSLWK